MSRMKGEKEARSISRSPVERTANTDTDKCSPQFKPTDIPEKAKKPNRAMRFTFLQNFYFVI